MLTLEEGVSFFPLPLGEGLPLDDFEVPLGFFPAGLLPFGLEVGGVKSSPFIFALAGRQRVDDCLVLLRRKIE